MKNLFKAVTDFAGGLKQSTEDKIQFQIIQVGVPILFDLVQKQVAKLAVYLYQNIPAWLREVWTQELVTATLNAIVKQLYLFVKELLNKPIAVLEPGQMTPVTDLQ